MSVSRRDLFMLAGVGAIISALPSKPSFAAAEKVGKMGAMLPPLKGNRVVVCGGGMGRFDSSQIPQKRRSQH